MTVLEQIDALRTQVEHLVDTSEAASKDIALMHCVKALRHAMNADGLTPTRRTEARSAYRMGMAALGLEH